MAAITTRSTAGSGATAGSTTVANAPLTNTQVDTNFINLNNDIASRLLATGGTTLYLGSQANSTRFPNAIASVSNVSTGAVSETTTNIGIIGESAADATRLSVGVYGVGYTSSANKGTGVQGEAHVVNPATDTTNAVGVRGYSTDVRSGTSTGLNIALFADASGALSAANNYALYMNTGHILSNVAQTWTLGGNLTFSGAFSVTIPTLALGSALTVGNGGTGVTTISGLVKGNGTSAFTAAVAGTDYQAAQSVTGIVKSSGVTRSAATSGVDYAPGTSALATGILKSTTTTGALSIATANTDYLTPPTGTSMLKAGSGGALVAAAAGTDYIAPYGSTTANFFLAAPNGAAGTPTFRAIVAADIPLLNQNTSGTAANVTGTVAIANGGTGATTAQAALNAVAGAVTSGSYLRGNGTNVVMSAIQAADVPTLNQNTTGSAATFTSTAQNSQFNSVGVGTPASATAGEIRATNNVTAFYTSDKKFKENIQDIPNALQTVSAIGGKLFDWTDSYINERGGADGYFITKEDFGVIAQDVQAVFPRAVRTKPDETLAVDYEKLCALAFAAINELSKEIEIMKGKI